MAQVNHYADLARHAIAPVLAGSAPNGTKPEDCGEWAPTVAGVFSGWTNGGTKGALRAWEVLVNTNPKIANVLSEEKRENEWGPVLSFHSAELPTFPLDIFPTWLCEYCEAVTETMQTPTDLAGMLALSILSAACARRFQVQAWNGWQEPVNVYTVTSLTPGNRKSGVFRAMMGPLIKFEQALAEKVETQVEQAEAHRDILKHQIEEAKRKASKVQGEHAIKSAFSDVDGLVGELKDMDVPARPKLIVDDVTPETVATILAEQGGRLAILSPEGDIFGIMAGRYSAGPPNIGVYLKSHAGETIRVDRRSRSEHIKQAALTIGITTQPEVMRSFGSNNAFRGQGLLARFFYALPRSTVGSRRSETEQIPDEVKTTYFHRMMMLLENMNSDHSVHSVQDTNSSHSGTDPLIDNFTNITTIEISIEAKNRLIAFMDWIEPQIGPYGGLAHIADWASKLAGATLRVAGLLHMAETLGQNGRDGQNCITDNELARAIRLAHYLLPHAQSAYAEIGADPAVDAAKTILRWIEKAGARTFTRRECYRGVRGPLFKSADDCDPALRLLGDHGYVREIETIERAGAGRKASTPYEANPMIFGQNGRNGQNASIPPIPPTSPLPTATYEPPTYRSMEGYD